jgi:hypothetical protein
MRDCIPVALWGDSPVASNKIPRSKLKLYQEIKGPPPSVVEVRMVVSRMAAAPRIAAGSKPATGGHSLAIRSELGANGVSKSREKI